MVKNGVSATQRGAKTMGTEPRFLILLIAFVAVSIYAIFLHIMYMRLANSFENFLDELRNSKQRSKDGKIN